MRVHRGLNFVICLSAVEKILCDLVHIIKVSAEFPSNVIFHIHSRTSGEMNLVGSNVALLNSRATTSWLGNYSFNIKSIDDVLLDFYTLHETLTWFSVESFQNPA